MADDLTCADEPEPTIADDCGPTPAGHDDFGTVADAGAYAPPDDGGTVASGFDPGHATVADVGEVAAPKRVGPADATSAFVPPGPSQDAAFARTEVATGADAPNGPEDHATVFGLQATDMATHVGDGPTRPSVGRAAIASPLALCGRYVLKEFYARGGMGEVWLAEDPVIGRSVALKRMLGDRPEQRKRFRVEAQITGRLEHPGIVPVHELGAGAGGDPYYVMKFVQGRTLKKVIEEFHARPADDPARELEQVRMLQMFLSLCQTVAYAHSRGVLHRDLKPDNVMLGPYGETVLLDWGIAKAMNQDGAEPETDSDGLPSTPPRLGDSLPDTGTRAGAVMGTPSYMAPEVAAGRNAEVDERSDIYLLGATLYEILTGKQPRSAKTVFEMIKKAEHEPPKPPRAVNPLIPRALDAICLKAMAHQKEDRYRTATALADDVQRFLAGEPVTAYREDALTRAWRWARRHRKALGRGAAAVLVGGLAVVAVSLVRDAERKRIAATRVAEKLTAEFRAREDLQSFRRLADEASFYAATTDPVSENAPYFDPGKGAATMSAALDIAEKWGPSLANLPLPDERAAVSDELYNLLLLAAHVEGRQNPGPEGATRMLAILDRAERRASAPTTGALRLAALANERLGKHDLAAELRRRANDPASRAIALDHFLKGENERDESSAKVGEQTERKPWQPDPARLERAIAEYRKALAIDPEHYWSRLQLARCFQGLGRYPEAIESLGACNAIRPKAPWGYTALGLTLAQQGRYAEAERELSRAVVNDSKPGVLLRGVVAWKQKKYDAALAHFAAVLGPPDGRPLNEAAYYRGHLYMERGEPDKALADFDRVVATLPRFRGAYLDRPLIYLARNEPARALADLDSYVALSRPVDPDGWERHGLRGRLLRFLYTELPLEKRAGPTGKAMLPLASAEILKAVEMGGKAPGLFDDLGAVMEHSGRVDLAVAAYTRGLEVDPTNAKLLIKRAWAYEQKGQHDRASADFAAAARSDPESAEAHTGLGYVQALRKLPPDAQREADLALLNGADQYLVLHNVACIYAALSQTTTGGQAAAFQDVAVALLRRSVKLWKQGAPGPSEIALMKGESAFAPLQGRKDFQELLKDGDATR